MAIDAPQTTAEASPERHQKASDLSRDVQSQFTPGDSTFKPGDHTKLNAELNGFGFPDIQVGNDNHLQEHGKDAQNVKYDNGNLTYDRPGPNGENQHVTLNMSDHPGLETVKNDNGQVTQATETDAKGQQHKTDYTYDAQGNITQATRDGQSVLPTGATQAKVDAQSGQLSYLTSGPAPDYAFKTTIVKPDGTQESRTKVNFQDSGNGTREWVPAGQAPINIPKDAQNAYINDNGHLIYSDLGNTVDVSPNGDSTTTQKDGIAINHNKNGELTGYSNPNPNAPQFKDGKWTNLPGINAGDQPSNVNIDWDGGVSYTTPAGITIDVSTKGDARQYSSHDYTMSRDPNTGQWKFQQGANDLEHPKVDIGTPKINSDGTVSAIQTNDPTGDQTKRLTRDGADEPLNVDAKKMLEESKQALELLTHPKEASDALKTYLNTIQPQLDAQFGEGFFQSLKSCSVAERATMLLGNPASAAILSLVQLSDGLDELDKANKTHSLQDYTIASLDLSAGVAGLTGAGADTLAPFGGEYAPVIEAVGKVSGALSLVLSLGGDVLKNNQ